MKFIVVADTHYDRDNYQGGTPPGSKERAELLVSSLQIENMDFFIINGDIIHGSALETHSTPLNALTEFKTDYLDDVGKPYYLVYGNHDRVTEQDWENLLGYGFNHSFVIDGYGFILLNSSSVSGAQDICIDETWLKNKLDEYKNLDGVFVFSHIPRFETGFSVTTESPQCEEIMRLFAGQSNLILVSNGHFHGYNHRQLRENNTTIVHTPHFGHYGTQWYGYRIFEVEGKRVKSTLVNVTDNVRTTIEIPYRRMTQALRNNRNSKRLL